MPKRKFYEILLLSLLQAIEAIGKELNIEVSYSRSRIHRSEGLIRLQPHIRVRHNDNSVILWSANVTRTVSLQVFDSVMSEALYAEVYSDLLKFVIRNNVRDMIMELSRNREKDLPEELKRFPKAKPLFGDDDDAPIMPPKPTPKYKQQP